MGRMPRMTQSTILHVTLPNVDTQTSYFHDQVFGDHAVASGQVAMDELLRRKIRHSVGDLAGHLDISAGIQ